MDSDAVNPGVMDSDSVDIKAVDTAAAAAAVTLFDAVRAPHQSRRYSSNRGEAGAPPGLPVGGGSSCWGSASPVAASEVSWSSHVWLVESNWAG